MLPLRTFAVLCTFLLMTPLHAAELETPEGAVVVTVAGKIANTNRPPYDPERDLFLKYHEKEFEKAAEFDRAMLEALGLTEVEVTVPGRPAPLHLEGPRLKDLLAAVGADGETVTLVALDGYGSEISLGDIDSLNWVVALNQDGKPLGLGQRGPLWVVYSYPDGRALTADDELRWPWATFYIEVR